MYIALYIYLYIFSYILYFFIYFTWYGIHIFYMVLRLPTTTATQYLYICDYQSILYQTTLVFKQNSKIFADYFNVQIASNVQVYQVMYMQVNNLI